MAASIDGALAEATAEPAPPGTLDFQAEAMEAAPALAAAEPVEAALPEPVEIAAAAPEPGTLEAQAAALDDGILPADTTLAAAEPAPEPGTLEAQAAALADAVLPAEPTPNSPPPWKTRPWPSLNRKPAPKRWPPLRPLGRGRPRTHHCARR